MYKAKPWDFGRLFSWPLVSRSQTNLRTSCLLIVPIISKPIDKRRGGA